MKKLLAIACAVGLAAAFSACSDVPSSLPDPSENKTATEPTEVTTEQTEASGDITTEDMSESGEDISQSQITTEPDEITDDTEDPFSVNEEAVEALTYGNWTQSNANAKADIIKNLIFYIFMKEEDLDPRMFRSPEDGYIRLTFYTENDEEISYDNLQLEEQLNSIDYAAETDSLLTLTYGILGLEEK